MRTSKNEIHLSGDGNDRKRKKERRGEKGPNNVSTTVEMTQTVGREKPMIASRVVGVLGWADDEEAGVSGGRRVSRVQTAPRVTTTFYVQRFSLLKPPYKSDSCFLIQEVKTFRSGLLRMDSLNFSPSFVKTPVPLNPQN